MSQRHRSAGVPPTPPPLLRTAVLAPFLAVALAAPAASGQAVLASATPDPAVAAGVPAEEVAAVRAATARYADVAAALADGYVAHPMCMMPEMEGLPRQLGAMGYHYFRPDLLGITATEPRVDGTGTHGDYTRPGVLLYEPQADGSLRLIGIENIIWAAAWKEAGNDGPPEYHGNQFYLRVDNPETPVDEAHGFQPHYELHWWLYRDNPAGVFAQFNPAVTCAHAPESHARH